MAASVTKFSEAAGRLFLVRRCVHSLQQTAAPVHVLAVAPVSSSSQTDEQAEGQECHLPRRAASRRNMKTDVRSESDPDRLAALLRTANLLLDRSPPLIAAEKLARAGRRDLVERVLEERYAAVVDAPSSKTERLLMRVMALYSTAGMVLHAERTFQRVPAKTERSLRALLAVYADNRLPARARECFERVPGQLGVAPGVGSCNVLVRALCEAGDVAGAAEFVRVKMMGVGVPPDICTFNMLLEAYLRKGDQRKFEEVVEEIGRYGLEQSRPTYNSRIAMLCSTGHTGLAGKVFEEMLARGVCPNRTTYNALISGSCREEQLEMAKRWFEELRRGKGGVAADGGTYTAMVRLMVERGEVAEAVGLSEECLDRGWALPFDVVRRLVSGLAAVGKPAEARRVVELMKPCVKGPAEPAWVKFESNLRI